MAGVVAVWPKVKRPELSHALTEQNDALLSSISRASAGRNPLGIFARIVCSPNRFTCEGFLLLLKGCMLGPDDFEFVSGLVFLAA